MDRTADVELVGGPRDGEGTEVLVLPSGPVATIAYHLEDGAGFDVYLRAPAHKQGPTPCLVYEYEGRWASLHG